MQISKLVSIITPVYNRLNYISDTIGSVQGQTYPHFEHIVVDDGSVDGTYELLQKFCQKGTIQLFCHKGRKNQGQSASINMGLTKAQGHYIAILDSDDMFTPEKLTHQVAFLEKNLDIGMVYGQGIAIDSYGKPLFKLIPANHKEFSDPNKLLLDCYIPLPGAALVRKAVYDQVGFFEESFRSGQDHDMALRVMETTKTAYLPEVAFYYRKHRDSISVNGLETRWKTGFEILKRAAQRYPYKNRTLRKRAAVLNFRLGQTYWRQCKYITAAPLLLKSALLDPARAIKVASGKEQNR